MKGTFHDLVNEIDDPIIKAYIAIIEKGLPKTASPKKIAIVGAGMAGLVSAQLLAEAGHHVTIAMGEAAMFAPGQLGELQKLVAPPVGNIHFAGDWTTLRHAWIEGAIESAIRASLEIEPTPQVKADPRTLLPIPPVVT